MSDQRANATLINQKNAISRMIEEKLNINPKMKYVYLIKLSKSEDLDSKYVYCKIGSARNPYERIKTLQTGSFFQLEIVTIIPLANLFEIPFQTYYSEYRGPAKNKEWFKFPLHIFEKLVDLFNHFFDEQFRCHFGAYFLDIPNRDLLSMCLGASYCQILIKIYSKFTY